MFNAMAIGAEHNTECKFRTKAALAPPVVYHPSDGRPPIAGDEVMEVQCARIIKPATLTAAFEHCDNNSITSHRTRTTPLSVLLTFVGFGHGAIIPQVVRGLTPRKGATDMTEEINDGQIGGEDCTPTTEEHPNTNRLQGLRCARCGSYEPFLITMTGTVEAYDAGTEGLYDASWDDDSDIECVACGHTGVVADFRNVSEEGSAA